MPADPVAEAGGLRLATPAVIPVRSVAHRHLVEQSRRSRSHVNVAAVFEDVWLVRHCTAGVKALWVGPDELRPLDAAGLVSAAILATTLPVLPTAVVASPTRRCSQTVQPLADRCGVDVGCDDGLGPDEPADRVLAVINATPSGSVLCTHGEVLERLYLLLRTGRLNVAGPVSELFAKGTAWHLTSDRRAVALTIHPTTSPAPRDRPVVTFGSAPWAATDERELHVARCLSTGWSFADIGLATGLTRAEVRETVGRIYRSMGVTSRHAAAVRVGGGGYGTGEPGGRALRLGAPLCVDRGVDLGGVK